MADGQRPLLVVCIGPQAGHYIPLLRIATALDEYGYPMIILGPRDIRAHCEGMKNLKRFFQVPDHIPTDERRSGLMVLPRDIRRWYWTIEHAFLAGIPSRSKLLFQALEIASKHASQPEELVIVQEACFLGSLPFKYGAPLPSWLSSLPRIVNISVIPYAASAPNVAPFGTARLPASTDAEKAEFANLYEAQRHPAHPMAKLKTRCNELLRQAGATRDFDMDVLDSWYTPWDRTLMLCLPEMEYPRDLDDTSRPRNVRFAGCLPANPVSDGLEYPDWWHEVAARRSRGEIKVVVTTQGTLATNYDELILKVISAFSNTHGVFVIALLGKVGATLPPGTMVAAENVRVLDRFPYDALLSIADCWVTNGGYGSFTSCVVHGVPMVVAGDDEDKPEVAQRVAWCGLGVNLGTGAPTEEQTREGVEAVLQDSKYAARAKYLRSLQDEAHAMDAISAQIMSVSGWRG